MAPLALPPLALRGELQVQLFKPYREKEMKKIRVPMAACRHTAARQCANMLFGVASGKAVKQPERPARSQPPHPTAPQTRRGLQVNNQST